MKSGSEFKSVQLVDQATDWATRGETLTIVEDEKVALDRAIAAVNHAVLALTEELRELRSGEFPHNTPVTVRCECNHAPVVAEHQNFEIVQQLLKQNTTQTVLAQLKTPLLILGGLVVLLLIACVVLALT